MQFVSSSFSFAASCGVSICFDVEKRFKNVSRKVYK